MKGNTKLIKAHKLLKAQLRQSPERLAALAMIDVIQAICMIGSNAVSNA